MSDPLDDRYLEWLYNLVGRQTKNADHWKLLTAMNSYEFVMLVPNDDNRCSDGEALRREFAQEEGIYLPRAWKSMGCSVLEMMISVSRHLAFEMDGSEGSWFWHLVSNLDLSRYNDSRFNERWINQVLERLVWRQYNSNGKGGLFPLKDPHEDQKDVEIWFQMEEYMLEMS